MSRRFLSMADRADGREGIFFSEIAKNTKNQET